MTSAAFKFNGLNENRLFGRDRANNASVRIFMASQSTFLELDSFKRLRSCAA